MNRLSRAGSCIIRSSPLPGVIFLLYFFFWPSRRFVGYRGRIFGLPFLFPFFSFSFFFFPFFPFPFFPFPFPSPFLFFPFFSHLLATKPGGMGRVDLDFISICCHSQDYGSEQAKEVFLLSGHQIGACGWIGEDGWARLSKAIFYSQLNNVCEHDRNHMTPKSKQKD